MKKILVVLLVLAVGTGVFAQGTWTLGGSGQIGSRINFDRYPKGDALDGTADDVAMIGATGYFLPYEDYSWVNGNIAIGYALGGFNGSMNIHTADGIEGEANLKGENYRFQFRGWLAHLLSNTDAKNWTRNRRLWGEYKLINGMVTLEAAYNSRDTEYWVSDKTGAFLGSDALRSTRVHNFGNDQSKTFTKVDHHNYLLGNVSVAGLDFGMILPNFFMSPSWNEGSRNWENNWAGKAPVNPYPAEVKFIDDVLKKSIIGAKFTMSPLEVAMQFMMEDYGIYMGGKFSAGPAVFGLSFMGLLNPDTGTDTHMKAGVSVAYSGGGFGAGLGGKFDTLEAAATGDTTTTIGVEPEFFYNAIPTHLQFKLNAGFYFKTVTTAGVKGDMEVAWGVQPQIFWNFLGTGAGTWYGGLNTGMVVRYRVFKDVANALDLVFKFSL